MNVEMKHSTHLSDSHRERGEEDTHVHRGTPALAAGEAHVKPPLPSVTFSVTYYPILPLKATIDVRPSTGAKMACSLSNRGSKLQKK